MQEKQKAWLAVMGDRITNESDECLELYRKELVRSAKERKQLLAKLGRMRSAYFGINMEKVRISFNG